MRFHFGNCRHDEAQENWNELCKSQDKVRELEKKMLEEDKQHSAFMNECEKRIKHLERVIDDLKKQIYITQPLYIEQIPTATFSEDKPKRSRKA